jgi:predicted acyl esterase
MVANEQAPQFQVLQGLRVAFDAPIPMDDGVVLRADVYLPIAEGGYPAIMSYGPYAKGLHFADGYADAWRDMCRDHPDVPANSSNAFQSWEVVDPEKWVRHGYAVVRVDSRGAGASPGTIDCFSPREARDFYDCIEWAAAQPWCSGRVGLSGISYYAIMQWRAAALHPPHLAAIIPWEGATDWYRDGMYHGGIYCTFGENWYPNQVATVQHGLGARAKTSRVTGLPVAGETTLTDGELSANQVEFGTMFREHPLDDSFHDGRRADLEAIEVPMLSAGNWGGHGLHLRGNVEGFVRSGSRQKWLEVHGLEHWTHFYTDYGRELQLEFFNYFLKDIDNGWNRRPPVLLNIRSVDETFELRAEEAWPIPRTIWTELYLDANDMSLVFEPPPAATVTYDALGEPVTFRTVITEDTEITGPAAAKLKISSTTVDADIFVVLRVFRPDATEVTFIGSVQSDMPVAHGWLRASHRELDEGRSAPYRPWHTHTRPQALAPGDIYDLDIEIWPTSIVIPAGYTLAVSVQGRDYEPPLGAANRSVGWLPMRGVGPFRHDRRSTRPPEIFGGKITLHTGGDCAPHVLLPFIPEQQ